MGAGIGVLAAACLIAQSGEISGRVRVTASLTKKRISLPQVYERHAALPAPAGGPADMLGELRRVVVYLEGPARPADAGKAVVARMDQKNRRFEPEVIAIPAGASVAFPNSDPIFHNVFSFSKARRFDLGNYGSGETRVVSFPEPGVVQLHCHLHPNMSGAILVTPNRWHAQPGSDGMYVLRDVPPGRHTVTAWHKSAGWFRRQIQLPAGGTVVVDFDIPLPAEASLR